MAGTGIVGIKQKASQIFEQERKSSQNYRRTGQWPDETVEATWPFLDNFSELTQIEFGLSNLKVSRVVEIPEKEPVSIIRFLVWILLDRGKLFKTLSSVVEEQHSARLFFHLSKLFRFLITHRHWELDAVVWWGGSRGDIGGIYVQSGWRSRTQNLRTSISGEKQKWKDWDYVIWFGNDKHLSGTGGQENVFPVDVKIGKWYKDKNQLIKIE